MQHEFREIPMQDGMKLRALIKENGSSKWLIVTHGVGEHLNRHHYFLKLFPQQFNLLIYDLRGHGGSEGKRGYIEDFSIFRKDLKSIIGYLRKEFALKNYSLFGHSMGALVTADFVQNETSEHERPDKVFLSAPPVGAPGVLGPIVGFSPVSLLTALTKLPYSIPISGVLDLSKLSHDGRVLEAYLSDKHVQLKIHTKLFLEILKRSREVFSRPLRSPCPIYVSVGSKDGLVNPQMLIEYFEQVEKNAKLKVIPGGYHELHNEVEKYREPYFAFLKESLTE